MRPLYNGSRKTKIQEFPTISRGPCVVGSTISDNATLSGTARNPDPANPGSNSTYPTINGGTKPADSNINWTLYGPGTGGAAQCTTAIANAPTPSFKAVSGDNTYGPVSYVSAAVGKYEFAVTYGGDGPNTFAATAVGCDNRRERRAGDRYRLGNQLVEAGLAAERPDHP